MSSVLRACGPRDRLGCGVRLTFGCAKGLVETTINASTLTVIETTLTLIETTLTLIATTLTLIASAARQSMAPGLPRFARNDGRAVQTSSKTEIKNHREQIAVSFSQQLVQASLAIPHTPAPHGAAGSKHGRIWDQEAPLSERSEFGRFPQISSTAEARPKGLRRWGAGMWGMAGRSFRRETGTTQLPSQTETFKHWIPAFARMTN